MTDFRYAKSQIFVHWIAAALITFLLVTGTLVLAEMPNTVEKIGNFRIHMILGTLAGVLVLVRIVLRKFLPAAPPVQGEKLAHLGHMAINLVVLVLVFSGVALSLQSGTFDAVFGTGALPANFDDQVLRKVHGLASRLTMGLIALHILAALYHQLIVKDRLLSRMGLGSKHVD